MIYEFYVYRVLSKNTKKKKRKKDLKGNEI